MRAATVFPKVVAVLMTTCAGLALAQAFHAPSPKPPPTPGVSQSSNRVYDRVHARGKSRWLLESGNRSQQAQVESSTGSVRVDGVVHGDLLVVPGVGAWGRK